MEQLQTYIDQYQTAIAEMSVWKMIFITTLIVVITFLPTAIAFFRNPGNIKKIFVANLGALLSGTVWFAALIWAVSGRDNPIKKNKEKLETIPEPKNV